LIRSEKDVPWWRCKHLLCGVKSYDACHLGFFPPIPAVVNVEVPSRSKIKKPECFYGENKICDCYTSIDKRTNNE